MKVLLAITAWPVTAIGHNMTGEHVLLVITSVLRLVSVITFNASNAQGQKTTLDDF